MNKKTMRATSKIWVPYGAGRKISRVMGVTEVTVSNALSGRSTTRTAELIRFRALNDFEGKEL